MRSGGIRGNYQTLFPIPAALKKGIVLELGFDQTAPYLLCDISSWAYDKVIEQGIDVVDNRAKQICCYCPEYTFVEKLQTISTKYRLQQQKGDMPINFLRHYYDIYQLLKDERILNFIKTQNYTDYKNERFRRADEKNIAKNPAFTIPEKTIREQYRKEFEKKSSIYFGTQPKFPEILEGIATHIHCL